jgi:hypothetical protein
MKSFSRVVLYMVILSAITGCASTRVTERQTY